MTPEEWLASVPPDWPSGVEVETLCDGPCPVCDQLKRSLRGWLAVIGLGRRGVEATGQADLAAFAQEGP